MASSSDTDLQYYLYMSEDWRGPYPLPQIRSFLKLGQIDEATYAYEPQHQSQLTVGDLLAGRKVMPAVMGSQAASGYGSSGSHAAVEREAVSDDVRSSGRLDNAINALGVMRTVCYSIGGTDGRERDDLLDDLKQAVDTIRSVLNDLRPSPAELRNFAVQIDRSASDVAARLSDKALTAHLVDMRDCVTHADPDEIIPAAEAVVAQVAHLARTAGDENPFEIVDDEAPANGDQSLDAYESARFELKGLQTDLSSVKDAYAKLQETYAKEQKQARRLILQLKEQLESEQKAHEGDNAELRALAAEIHDLASACGLADTDPAVARDLARLAEELQHTHPLSLVPVAESVLNRMVSRLGSGSSEVAEQLRELTSVRAELLQLKTDMSMLRQREEQLLADKARLQKQLDEERGAASRVDQNARAREAQLKSTIAALQVTKELHQEVMGDLQDQLRGAQDRVEAMERELVSARDELKGTRSSFEDREQTLVAELEQLSRTRGELETRQSELSNTLQSAERELAQARDRVAQSEEDESLAEALAAKVNELRASFEQTRLRLREQEGNAGALQQELAAARSEAAELRSRSDQMASELEGARGNLESARRRMDELQRAAARLEAERSALQGELHERKGTDTITRDVADSGHLRSVVAGLEHQVASAQARISELEAALDDERARADELRTAHGAVESRHDDLLAERATLRGELDAVREAGGDQERLSDLEDRLAGSERALRDTGEARSDLQAKLASVAAERDRLNGELTRLRTEFEASAVEHRAAIAAARKGQTEAATRAAELKTQLEAAEAERERLGDEVESQRQALATGADNETRLSTLNERLATETARADQIGRDLEASRRDYATAQVKLERLRTDLQDAEQERDRLANEIARRHDASSMRDAVDADGRSRLQEALDRLREQLEREQRRSTDLERRLEAARGDARSAATRHAETAGSYADAVARADRLASDVAEERARHAAELVDAERRLATERERARTLETRLADLDGRLAASTARQVGLERSISDLTGERERLSRDLGDARQARTDADKRADELAARVRAAETELADVQADVALAAEQREAVSSELASTTGRHSRLAVTVERLTKELAQARSRIDSANTEHDAALQAVKTQLDAERATITALQDRIATAERERDGARERVDGLQQRLTAADQERSTLLADTERLRHELERAATSLRPGADPGELAQLRARLAEAESRLAATRHDLDDTAQRGADRLLELEERLAAEQAKAADLDVLREQLRVEAVQHQEARIALAAVTAARDTLRDDLERLRAELAQLKAASTQDRQAGDRLVILDGQLAGERDKVMRLEADLAIARSREQVATASRDGLESSLGNVVADRERLLAEVDKLRGELDQLRLQMRGAAPEQQAEIAALKHMLGLERERVQQLEERLAEAWRKQGETQALTDGELRRRLEAATARIDKLKHRLRAQRRKTETAVEEADRLRRTTDRRSSGDLSSGMRTASAPSVDLNPKPTEERRSSNIEAGGFISAFGRPAVNGDEPGQPANYGQVPGFTSRFGPPAVPRVTSGPHPGITLTVRRRRRHLGRWIGLGVAAATVMVLGFWALVLPRLFTYSPLAVVNAEIAPVVAPITGEISEVLLKPGDPVLRGSPIALMHNGRLDTTTLDDLTARRTRMVQAVAAAIRNHEAQTAEATRLESALTTWRDERATAVRQELDRLRADRDRERLTLAEHEARITALRHNESPAVDMAEPLVAVEQAKARLSLANDLLLASQAELDTLVRGERDSNFPSQLALTRLRQELPASAESIATSEASVVDLDARLADERARLTALRDARISADDDGVLLRLQASSGRWLRAGEPVAQIARPETTIIETILPDRAPHAVIGAEVRISLIGQRRETRGKIIAIFPAGNDLDHGLWADDFAHRNRYRSVARIALIDDARDVQLNQGARLIILGQNPGFVREWLAGWYAIGKF